MIFIDLQENNRIEGKLRCFLKEKVWKETSASRFIQRVLFGVGRLVEQYFNESVTSFPNNPLEKGIFIGRITINTTAIIEFRSLPLHPKAFSTVKCEISALGYVSIALSDSYLLEMRRNGNVLHRN